MEIDLERLQVDAQWPQPQPRCNATERAATRYRWCKAVGSCSVLGVFWVIPDPGDAHTSLSRAWHAQTNFGWDFRCRELGFEGKV